MFHTSYEMLKRKTINKMLSYIKISLKLKQIKQCCHGEKVILNSFHYRSDRGKFSPKGRGGTREGVSTGEDRHYNSGAGGGARNAGAGKKSRIMRRLEKRKQYQDGMDSYPGDYKRSRGQETSTWGRWGCVGPSLMAGW